MDLSIAFVIKPHKDHNYIHSCINKRLGAMQVYKLGKELAEKR